MVGECGARQGHEQNLRPTGVRSSPGSRWVSTQAQSPEFRVVPVSTSAQESHVEPSKLLSFPHWSFGGQPPDTLSAFSVTAMVEQRQEWEQGLATLSTIGT